MISWESFESRAAFLSWRNGCDYDTGVDLDPLFEHATNEELSELHVATRYLLRRSRERIFVFCPRATQDFGGMSRAQLLVATLGNDHDRLSFTALYGVSDDVHLASLETIASPSYEPPIDAVARYETFSFNAQGQVDLEASAHTSIHNMPVEDAADDALHPSRGLYLGMRFAVQTELTHSC